MHVPWSICACALEHLQDPGWASLVGQTVKESTCNGGGLDSNEYIYTHVHHSVVYNSQKLETTHMSSTDELIKKY